MNSFNTIGSGIVSKIINTDASAFNDSLYENTGLYGEITWGDSGFYEGYPSYFIVNTIEGTCNITNLDSLTNAVLPLAQKINASYTASTLNTSATIYHCQWTGYFKADFTGTWTFSLNTLNFGMLWIGDTAITNDKSNALLTDTGDNIESTQTINLINGKYYPIRITWGKRTSVTNPAFSVSFTRNATTITNLTSYLYSAKTNKSTLVGIPTVFIKKNANTIDNLYAPKLFAYYTDAGYHNNVVDFVQNNPIYNGSWSGLDYVANIGSITEASTTLGFTIVHNAYSLLYTGYFKADFTGTFTFNLNTDDETYLWIGDYANTGYTTSNRLVYSYVGSNGSGSISLTNGQYYPIRILYGQNTSSAYCNLTFTRNSQTITNWTGYTFHPITPTNGNPKMFIEEIVYIGGADSPLNSYFTDYYVNVPYGVNLDKYAGRYDVTSSSYYNNVSQNEIAKPFNVFKGGTAMVNSFAYTNWWGGGAGSVGYESITEYSLGYTTNSYAADGVYQGGGSATNTFSTTYYTTGATTATASGEWIQISTPYNMMLTSYSARSRFTDSRLPVQYVILGSNNGSTWYALDVVDIGAAANYSPLKKYTINTTTYPYSGNYYSHFRYVIQKLDTKVGATITDKQYAHENQWNLVGVKEPITQDIVYIGGLSSPIKSYFTDYIINVPTIDGSLNKYAGNYAVTSSSIYTTSWLPYILFNDSFTFSPATAEYGPGWHAGGAGSSFKPMTNQTLNYTLWPYDTTLGVNLSNSNGTYVGGGNASVTYSTTYYTTGNTTATASGEWVQIFVPYNMKLISYSNLSRYKSTRLPVQYVILGSTDGSTWYALDVVNIGSWDKYIPLKKYNINTTAYPYGNNYYCFFRYVIQKLDTKPTTGDRVVANESQWNLVGMKETINPDYVYIGGKNSPITSYFTNYIVNVPTGVSIDKYAGSYEINSSSYYNNNDGANYKVYNIFKGNNSMNNSYTYTTTWIAATDLGYGYKSITDAALNYSQTPYNNSNGTYVGGGNASITYSTTYYTTGATTATATGEWAQINVPYNMKLTSYSNRTRFINMRVPVQYVILGSNNGSTWYALDVVDIGTWENYIPLKNYKVNTTTNPYADNYYSYFRYVIKKIDSNLSIANYDRKYVNENQWNLVGIKETPNANVGKPIYIGANSPTGFTSYFTSRNVTIPSNFVSPEYVGTYTVSESSTSSTPNSFNLFVNGNTNDGVSYIPIWHCGYTGSVSGISNAYVNDVSVTYDRQPYVSATGNYQGATGYYFTTPYYKTANSTYYSSGFAGEWVQIKLPFRMKLTGYSHRTRYVDIATNGRNPDYYDIFGSNDGIIWYIVDDQQTATTTLNTININTSTYPDAKHGFSYFRWIINSLTKGDVANENQWNLIGIRTT
jgi:GLEYA domain